MQVSSYFYYTVLIIMDHVCRQSTGRTALSFAAEQGYVEIIKLLIIHGADVDIRDKVHVNDS